MIVTAEGGVATACGDQVERLRARWTDGQDTRTDFPAPPRRDPAAERRVRRGRTGLVSGELSSMSRGFTRSH